ncbi:hypothetical protein B0H14DRAFT_2617886 [Mycena olivaceomarginata]|nr:hypothetical protein B0H14DRAFT_2617886 [Mycena olivaceomarginata]
MSLNRSLDINTSMQGKTSLKNAPQLTPSPAITRFLLIVLRDVGSASWGEGGLERGSTFLTAPSPKASSVPILTATVVWAVIPSHGKRWMKPKNGLCKGVAREKLMRPTGALDEVRNDFGTLYHSPGGCQELKSLFLSILAQNGSDEIVPDAKPAGFISHVWNCARIRSVIHVCGSGLEWVEDVICMRTRMSAEVVKVEHPVHKTADEILLWLYMLDIQFTRSFMQSMVCFVINRLTGNDPISQ